MAVVVVVACFKGTLRCSNFALFIRNPLIGLYATSPFLTLLICLFFHSLFVLRIYTLPGPFCSL
jgi:hypothetical protein